MFGSPKRKDFDKLAREIMSPAYAYALRLTSDPDSAQDLLQDTFMKAYRYFDSFEIGTNFKAWIFKIMTRVYYDRYRAESRDRQMRAEVDDIEALGVVDDGGERSVLARELEQALDELPEEFRIPVIMCDIHGLSYKETAEALGIPMGTVMSRLNRGRRKLRQAVLRREGAGNVIHMGVEP